tara:strand:+ start:125 stop:364 length:240 start_codon:yes stop_codon:yes gene_type:complete
MTQDFDGGLRKKKWSGRRDLNKLPKTYTAYNFAVGIYLYPQKYPQIPKDEHSRVLYQMQRISSGPETFESFTQAIAEKS